MSRNFTFIFSFLLIIFCSCNNDTTGKDNKDENAKNAINSTIGIQNNEILGQDDYWAILNNRVEISENLVEDLKKLNSQEKIEKDRAKGKAEVKSITTSYNEKEKLLLGKPLYQKKAKFDTKWNNSLSMLHLGKKLELNNRQKNNINKISRSFLLRWREKIKTESRDQLPAIRKQLLKEKLEKVNTVLNEEQVLALSDIMKSTNLKGRKGLYPF